jgi:hypothetical protein
MIVGKSTKAKKKRALSPTLFLQTNKLTLVYLSHFSILNLSIIFRETLIK